MDGSEETQARFDALALYASELRANGSTRCLSESPFLSPLTPYFPSPISPFPSRAATELRRQSPGSAAGATFRRPPSGSSRNRLCFFLVGVGGTLSWGFSDAKFVRLRL
ncbi:hypothetical protein B296_00017953 [Ensete ventricosum]|uniref:Uncharacterized protein n=1 Tax=Ensete ventricosum TaxID=4639 RepID=A0A426ZG71_ENSVE|nr:hypothetical protein B296_00017953 [Ensete ventricosum]